MSEPKTYSLGGRPLPKTEPAHNIRSARGIGGNLCRPTSSDFHTTWGLLPDTCNTITWSRPRHHKNTAERSRWSTMQKTPPLFAPYGNIEWGIRRMAGTGGTGLKLEPPLWKQHIFIWACMSRILLPRIGPAVSKPVSVPYPTMVSSMVTNSLSRSAA